MPTFIYQAQTVAGQPLNGTLESTDAESARQTLESLLLLRVISLERDPSQASKGARPMSPADFQAFNLQLAHLTAAGLPVERGLRMMAEEMGSKRLASATRAVAADLERGVPLDQAFDNHKKSFPSMYARLLKAGVQTANLPGMLMAMSRHLELLSSLRAALWRALAYPFLVLIGFELVLIFAAFYVLPEFRALYSNFKDVYRTLPLMTNWILDYATETGWIAIFALLITVALPLVIHGLAILGRGPGLVSVLSWLPVIRPVLRKNLLARWCDGLLVGVESGMALPQALDVASSATHHWRLQRDTEIMIDALSAGKQLDSDLKLKIVPKSLVVALRTGVQNGDLPRVTTNMAEMYRSQARERMTVLPTVLTPIFVITLGSMLMILMMALFAPLLRAMQFMEDIW